MSERNYLSQSSVGKAVPTSALGILQEEAMRSRGLKYNVGRAVRVGIVALGMIALTAPAVMIPSSPDALARGGGKGGGDKGGDIGGLSGGSGGAIGGALGGVGDLGGLAGPRGGGDASAGMGGGTGGGPVSGGNAAGPGTNSATEGSAISSAFETLSRPQQARVMQRCKDVVARPAQADPNQLAICQTLLAMARP
jgi:hypothetical protein